MAINFNETDTNAPLGVLQACADVAPAAGADAKQCTVGGTAGTTEVSTAVPAGSTVLFYCKELDIADSDSLDAGTLVHRINISTAQPNLTLENIYVCRVNSSGVSQEELGSATALGTDISAGGIFTTNITLSAASAHNAGDKVYITASAANSHAMTSRNVSTTPDQVIDTPFTAGATTHQVAAPDGADAGDSATDAITQPVTATDGADAGDSAVGGLLVQTDAADGADAGDSATALVGSLVQVAAPDGVDAGDSAGASVSTPLPVSKVRIIFS